ncbi:MAG: NADH-quinone oxidoreductase subunit NuoE [Xylanivirga thermophila]|jgi:NADH-quinone oxidoreductase E subunit|uniref:NADH-quinone oxidoreductase subunit NuoE n=1 Tax=Xylanivirga thermophila TaxID=2496273 RepID=UPI00101CCB07|nr:NADH-quinone oxidoreductase subunit NuoE [Xylanivirga thermophila]
MSASFLAENKEKFEELQKVVEEYKGSEGPLMPILHKAQEIFGCIPLEVQNYIAESLDIPITDIYGVVTFYSQFTLKPSGKYRVAVCLGTACYVKGAQKILDELTNVLGITVGDTTSDGKFTLDATRCLGACGLAPVMMVNDDVYGRLVPEDIAGIIQKYK